jgi:hypothetical protein
LRSPAWAQKLVSQEKSPNNLSELVYQQERSKNHGPPMPRLGNRDISLMHRNQGRPTLLIVVERAVRVFVAHRFVAVGRHGKHSNRKVAMSSLHHESSQKQPDRQGEILYFLPGRLTLRYFRVGVVIADFQTDIARWNRENSDS